MRIDDFEFEFATTLLVGCFALQPELLTICLIA